MQTRELKNWLSQQFNHYTTQGHGSLTRHELGAVADFYQQLRHSAGSIENWQENEARRLQALKALSDSQAAKPEETP